MSNLIKSVYFNVAQDDKRIIDSDSHVDEYIPNIFSAPVERQEINDFQAMSFDEETEHNVEFQDGMNVIKVDDMLEEEKQKLSEENEKAAAKIIEEAQAKADQMINDANEYAETIKNNAYEEGMNQGLEEGKVRAKAEQEQLKAEFDEECSKRYDEISKYENSLEEKFADIMISLISKITGVLCEDRKDVIIFLIDNALHNVSKSKNITIRVSNEDFANVNSAKDKLKEKLSSDTELDIAEDSNLSENQCIIETDSGIIDCSLDAQIDNLKEKIRLISLS